MRLDRELFKLVFVIDEEYNDVEKSYVFSEEKDESAAYCVFILSLLDPYIKEIAEYDVHIMDDSDLEEYEKHLDDFKSISYPKEKSILDVYDKEEKTNRIFAFKPEHEEDFKKVLSVSCLEWYVNDYKRLSKIEDECDEALREMQEESELAKDPYSYYGVSRSDFY